MNKKINLSLVSFLALAIVGCNWGQPNTVEKKTPKTIIENNIKTAKKVIPEVEFIPVEKATEADLPVFYEAKVSEQEGASIVFSINPQDLNFKTKQSGKKLEGFNTLANTNGTLAKTVADIDHYVVYLVKNASANPYPLNGDPLGTDLVGSGFNLSVSGENSVKVRFTNVQSSGTDYYYVAVRAQDAGNNDLIKDNNGSGTAWTNTTATTPGVAVSTGAGISVNASLVVTPTTALSVIPNLQDGTGATIEATITPTAGGIGSAGAIPIGKVSTVAGTGTFCAVPTGACGDGGQATDAQLSQPYKVAVDNSGNIFIADGTRKIRRIDNSTDNISTVAGNGSFGTGGDGGQATDAQLDTPGDLAIDSNGNIFVALPFTNKIRRIDNVTGNISTFAGTGTAGSSGDGGQATDAQINVPYGVAVDNNGNVFISDSQSDKIRRVDIATGNISTVAGDGSNGSGGDGGPATDAQLSSPSQLTIDSSNNIYIVDSGNNKIRRVDNATGNISTVAGDGSNGSGGDGGPATDAQLSGPVGVLVDNSGNIFITDTGNNKIRRVDNATGNISTVVGTGTAGSAGDDGPGSDAELNTPTSVALIDSTGNIYISDYSNHKIRKFIQ